MTRMGKRDSGSAAPAALLALLLVAFVAATVYLFAARLFPAPPPITADGVQVDRQYTLTLYLMGAGYLAALQPLHRFITVAAFITAGAQLLFLYNFFRSLQRGAKAAANPWNATTLEWTTASPPPRDNFGGRYPSVYRGPYEYSVPGAREDFIPQNLAPEEVARVKEESPNAR